MSAQGTELKINVHVEPIGNVHLSDCEFTCTFFIYSNKSQVIKKNDMIKVDEDNYIARVDTTGLGQGTIHMKIEVDVPDNDFADGYRKEVDVVCTGITITSMAVCR